MALLPDGNEDKTERQEMDMLKFEKNEEDQKVDSTGAKENDLSLDSIEKEIVELVDIVDEPVDELGDPDKELALTEEAELEGGADSPLEDIDFPTEIREVAEEFDKNDRVPSDGRGLALENEDSNIPFGDKVIAESLGLDENDSLVTAIRKGEKRSLEEGFGNGDESTPEGTQGYEEALGKERLLEDDSGIEDVDRTLVMNMPGDLSELGAGSVENDEPVLSLTEEVEDQMNTTFDTDALKNCPHIEDSLQIRVLAGTDDKKTEEEGAEKSGDKTEVDLSISEILSTDSLENDLKEELREEFMGDSNEQLLQETQVDLSTAMMLEPQEQEPEIPQQQEEKVEASVGEETSYQGVTPEEKVLESVSVESVMEALRPEISDLIIQMVKEELPVIVEKVVLEELAKVKKLLTES